MRSRPNILLISTDQQRADHLGVKGLRAVRTPHLDRLARGGVHFDRAYCPSPMCTPTRVSLLTGRYPSSHGAYSIGVSLPSMPGRTLPAQLGHNGYRTALFGKSHFVSRQDEERHMAGMDAPPPPEFFRGWRGPYLGFQEFEGSTGHTINAWPAQHYRVFLEDSGVDWHDWFPCRREDYDHYACGPWNIPEQYHDTAWVAERTQDFIGRQAGEHEPWFCWASFQDPHEPFVCPEPWFSLVDPALMDIPEDYREGEFADRHSVYEACYRRELGPWKDGQGVPCVYGSGKRSDRRKAALQATLGMLAFIDDRVGLLIQKLEETGQVEDTIIVFTSDHGEMHGHHGLWGKGVTAYEDCQRVPLLVWGPGRVEALGTIAPLVNLVDLPATVLSLAGVTAPVGMQGVDLSPVLRGEKESVQDCTLIECRPTTTTLYQQTLVTSRYKLVLYRDGEDGELYDLETDPDQYRNCWSEPSMRSLREALLLRLGRFQMEREGRVESRVSFS
ncbi:MAG: sulfatase-like hydrolase/transferase [Opitutaceae bacterium]